MKPLIPEKLVDKVPPDAVEPAAADDPATNPYIGEAIQQAAGLHALAERYPDNEPPLTPAEQRLVTMTSIEALEQAALFAEATPNVGGALNDVGELRDTIHYVFAQQRVREAAAKVIRLVDQSIDRKKLKGVRIARGLYRMAKAYAVSTSNDTARAHIEQMQRTLRTLPRRRKAPTTPAVKAVQA